MDFRNHIEYNDMNEFMSRGAAMEMLEKAMKANIPNICVPPYYIQSICRVAPEGSIKIITAAGFPCGLSAVSAKVEEIKRALDEGAHEIEATINHQAIKSGDWSYVQNEIQSMTRATHLRGKTIKIVFNPQQLTEAELVKVCEVCNHSEVNYLKIKLSTPNVEKKSITLFENIRQCLSNASKMALQADGITLDELKKILESGIEKIGTNNALAFFQNK